MMCATPIVGAVLDVVVWLRSLGPTMWCCAKISVTSSSSSNAATFRAPLWENPKRRVAPALGAYKVRWDGRRRGPPRMLLNLRDRVIRRGEAL